MTQKAIGVFGGTFDPVHCAHLRMALELCRCFHWQQVRFIPCREPVLRKTAQATAQQRLTMLQLAVENQPELAVDDRELRRATPSYTIETLSTLHDELPGVKLYLILGSDSVNGLHQWRRWRELIHYSHWVIVPRVGHVLATQGPVAEFIKQYPRKITLASLSTLAISSTNIRQQIASGLSPRGLLPDAVWDYIQQQNLYSNNSNKTSDSAKL